ncbi:MAG TPA: HAD family hydrolase [Anaerolineales bacterium]|nr:HAD family hydrolase [Anaerolineales bacterium]
MKQTLPFSALFLDIGGVLLTNGWDRGARTRAAEKFDLKFDEINERHHLTFDTFEEGKLSLDEYLSRVVFYEPRSFSREEFKAFMYSQSQPLPKMIEFIRELKPRYKLRLAAVSNEGRELTEYRVRHFKLDAFIDFFVSSCFVHYRKPDKDMYRIALDISQVRPEQAIYIDDRDIFVQVARGLNITGITHVDYETTKQSLEELGLRLPR